MSYLEKNGIELRNQSVGPGEWINEDETWETKLRLADQQLLWKKHEGYRLLRSSVQEAPSPADYGPLVSTGSKTDNAKDLRTSDKLFCSVSSVRWCIWRTKKWEHFALLPSYRHIWVRLEQNCMNASFPSRSCAAFSLVFFGFDQVSAVIGMTAIKH